MPINNSMPVGPNDTIPRYCPPGPPNSWPYSGKPYCRRLGEPTMMFTDGFKPTCNLENISRTFRQRHCSAAPSTLATGSAHGRHHSWHYWLVSNVYRWDTGHQNN